MTPNPQITDAVTQLLRNTSETITGLTNLIDALKLADTSIPTLTEKISEFKGLSEEEKRMIMMTCADAGSAMLATERILRSKNGG